MDERKTEARRMRREGMTYQAIADVLKVHPQTIRRWIPSDRYRELAPEMLRLREQGMNNSEIATALGMSRQYVSAVIGSPSRRKTTGKRVTFNLAASTWKRLYDIAHDLGLRPSHAPRSWQSMIGMLLDGIASGDLIVRWRDGAGPHLPLGKRKDEPHEHV